MGAPAPPKAPAPPTAPAPPKALGANAQAQSSQVAVLESAEFLPAHSVVLDEFLVPEELNELLQYTQEHEADFEISEVISPGARGTAIDYQHRRSRVLMSLDKHHEVLANRIQACMPRVLQKVGRDVFPVSQVEAQITASNHGDFFRQHSDNDQAPIASREVTFVYFFSP